MNKNDKIIFDKLNTDITIPDSYLNSIYSTFDKLPDNTQKKFEQNKLKYSLTTVFCSIILVTGVVFAKDIENYIRSLFNNSNEAIDTAVENGYVQHVDVDYAYDNDIGIKIDNIVLDDLNLDIAYNIRLSKENIKMARLNDFTITNDNEKVVYRSEFKYAETIEDLPLYNSVSWTNFPEKIDDTTFSDSILLGLRPEYETFDELYFDIKGIQIIYEDNTQEVIEGNWQITVEISDEMKQNSTVIYTMVGENEYIESCTATMSKTGTLIEMISKAEIPTNPDIDLQSAIFLNGENATYPSGWLDFSKSNMNIHFENVGSFIENSNTLELKLGFFDTVIILEKENINDDMRKNTSIKYTLEKSDEYVENCTGTLAPTGLIIEVNLAKKLDMKKMHEELPLPIDTITLNSNTNTYKPNFMDYSEYYMKLHFDNIGTFVGNEDKLKLCLKFFDHTITLTKEQ